MDAPSGYEIIGERAYYKPEGEMTVEQGIELVTRAIIRTREHGVRELLVNVASLKLPALPTVSDRYTLGDSWSRAAQGSLFLAVVARQEMIDPSGFGILVLNNRGLESAVFLNEDDANHWLDGKR